MAPFAPLALQLTNDLTAPQPHSIMRHQSFDRALKNANLKRLHQQRDQQRVPSQSVLELILARSPA
jgi:hypothetical protein